MCSDGGETVFLNMLAKGDSANRNLLNVFMYWTSVTTNGLLSSATLSSSSLLKTFTGCTGSFNQPAMMRPATCWTQH